MKFYLIVLLTFLMYAEAFSQEARIGFDVQKQDEVHLIFWKYHAGDSTVWASCHWNDDQWSTINWDRFIPVGRGIHWLRTRVYLHHPAKVPILLRTAIFAYPFEIYLNGTLIAKNGQLGSESSKERQGKTSFAAILPESLLVQDFNLFAIRFSNYTVENQPTFRVRLDTKLYENLYRPEFLFRQLVYSAICLTCSLIGFALFLGGGRFKPYLLFSLMCLPPFGIKLFQFIIYYFNLEPSYNVTYTMLYDLSFILSDLFFISFLLFIFVIPRKLVHIGGWICVGMLFSLIRTGATAYLFLFGSYLLALILYSMRAKKPGSILALAGWLIYLLPRLLVFFGFTIISIHGEISFLVTILILLFIATRQVQEQEKGRRSSELRAQRLEIELLKRTIQPHFLLNTLSSVKSLLNREPDEADELIEALANEFRMISAISSEHQIPLRQELELCRYHLKIMSYRWNAQYQLHAGQMDEEAPVPPLILHTLIENGFTHSFKPNEEGQFWISCEKENRLVRYTLKNNGSLLSKLPLDGQVEEGMGIKYVKSRLEESYPGKWELQYGMRDAMWEVIITLHRR